MKAAKNAPVKDPEIRFTGPKASTRVFLRTDGLYAVTIDRGETFHGLRYEVKQILKSIEHAAETARRLAGAS